VTLCCCRALSGRDYRPVSHLLAGTCCLSGVATRPDGPPDAGLGRPALPALYPVGGGYSVDPGYPIWDPGGLPMRSAGFCVRAFFGDSTSPCGAHLVASVS